MNKKFLILGATGSTESSLANLFYKDKTECRSVFFALHQIFLALLVIVAILLLVIWLTKLYYPINKLSAALMVPYIIWLGFAFVLNLNILLLN